jgi:hypothetical protein
LDKTRAEGPKPASNVVPSSKLNRVFGRTEFWMFAPVSPADGAELANAPRKKEKMIEMSANT